LNLKIKPEHYFVVLPLNAEMKRLYCFYHLKKIPPPARLKTVLLFGLLLFCCCSCAIFKKHKKSAEPDYIEGVVKGQPQRYHYLVQGIYDTAHKKINLSAHDTTLDASKMWTLHFELGQGSLDTMKLPHTFSKATDAFSKQTVFAHVVWDNMESDHLLDNYTYRSWSDLTVTIISKDKDVLKGYFHGTLLNMKKKVIITSGSFSVKMKRQ
jgi:hypothetical protein